MHYFRAPFALLATTFAITILATPLNGPAHVPPFNTSIANVTGNVTTDEADLFLSLGLANQAVQVVNEEFKTSNLNETGPQLTTTLNDFSIAINNVHQAAFLMQAVGTFDEDISQRLISLDVLPLFDSLNNTAELTNQQAQSIHDRFSDVVLGDFFTLLTEMSSAKDHLEAAIGSTFFPSAVEQLNTISMGVNNSFNAALSLPVFLFRASR